MLVVDPKKRLSAGEALSHKWFSVTTDSVVSINVDVLNRLRSFRGVSKLKKAAMNMLVKMADQNQIEELRTEFTKIDKDQTGLISSEELREAIKQSDIKIADGDVDKIIEEVDYFGNGKINYTEFLVATVDVMKFLDEQMMVALFN